MSTGNACGCGRMLMHQLQPLCKQPSLLRAMKAQLLHGPEACNPPCCKAMPTQGLVISGASKERLMLHDSQGLSSAAVLVLWSA